LISFWFSAKELWEKMSKPILIGSKLILTLFDSLQCKELTTKILYYKKLLGEGICQSQ
jgi:hypothetical protein